MASWIEGVQKRARALGEKLEDTGASIGKAIDDAVEPAVEKLNTKAYQETKAAKKAIIQRRLDRSAKEKKGSMR